jgi:hypothetical protein
LKTKTESHDIFWQTTNTIAPAEFQVKQLLPLLYGAQCTFPVLKEKKGRGQLTRLGATEWRRSGTRVNHEAICLISLVCCIQAIKEPRGKLLLGKAE